MKMKRIYLGIAALAALAVAGCHRDLPALRVAYTPNLPDAAAIVGVASGRYARVAGIPVQASVFNSGPAEIEALLGHNIDIAYVGPVPALVAFVRSKGGCVIVAGAAEGGAALVASKLSEARTPADLHNARVATPQTGDTQDVAARGYFGELGFTSYEHGGNFRVTPAANADLTTMFQGSFVQAAWTVEPWVTQLVEESGARLLLDESALWGAAPATGTYITSVVIAREDLVKDHPEVLEAFLRLHAESTEWIKRNPAEAQSVVADAISKSTHRLFTPALMAKAWPRVHFTTEVSPALLQRNAENAARVGFLSGDAIETDKLIYRRR